MRVTVVAAAKARSNNHQRITVQTDASAPGGGQRYDRGVDLNEYYDSAQGTYRPIVAGDILDARVRPGQPPELRVRGDDAYQASFFRFVTYFFGGIGLTAAVYVLVRSAIARIRHGRNPIPPGEVLPRYRS